MPWAAESGRPGPRPGRGSLPLALCPVPAVPRGSVCCLGLSALFARWHPQGMGLLGNRGRSQHLPNGCGALKALLGGKCSHRARSGPDLRLPRTPHPASFGQASRVAPARLPRAEVGSAELPPRAGAGVWPRCCKTPLWAARGPGIGRAAPLLHRAGTVPCGLCTRGPEGMVGFGSPGRGWSEAVDPDPVVPPGPSVGSIDACHSWGAGLGTYVVGTGGPPRGPRTLAPLARVAGALQSPPMSLIAAIVAGRGPQHCPPGTGTLAPGLASHPGVGQLWGTALLALFHISPQLPQPPQPCSLSPPGSHGRSASGAGLAPLIP